jgi:hypothetical protein
MRRLVFVALAVLAAGGALWLRVRGSTSSFAPYSDVQLVTLEQAYRAVMRSPPAPGATSAAQRERALDAELSLEQVTAEQSRRLALRSFLAVALLATVGALLSLHRASRRDRGEEARMREVLGDPALFLEGERHRAAALLGVSRDAPREVIEAAYAARLAAHDPERLEGLAPEMRRMVLDRQQAFRRARDLLAGDGAGAPGKAPQQ